MRIGNGVFIWKDGSKYEEKYLYDKKHGLGKYIKSNGDVSERSFKNNVF